MPLLLIYAVTRSKALRDNVWVGAQAVAVTSVLLVIGSSILGRNYHAEPCLARESIPSGVVQRVAADAFPTLNLSQATLVGRLLFAPFYCCALWLATRRFRDLVFAVFLTLFCFLGLAAANFKIWYASWVVPFSATGTVWRRMAGLLMTYGATISAAFYAYLYLWTSNFALVNNLAYAFVFVPPAVVLLVPAVRRVTGIHVASVGRTDRLRPGKEA